MLRLPTRPATFAFSTLLLAVGATCQDAGTTYDELRQQAAQNLAARDLTAGLICANRAIALDSHRWEAHLLRARLLLASHRLAEASDSARQAMDMLHANEQAVQQLLLEIEATPVEPPNPAAPPTARNSTPSPEAPPGPTQPTRSVDAAAKPVAASVPSPTTAAPSPAGEPPPPPVVVVEPPKPSLEAQIGKNEAETTILKQKAASTDPAVAKQAKDELEQKGAQFKELADSAAKAGNPQLQAKALVDAYLADPSRVEDAFAGGHSYEQQQDYEKSIHTLEPLARSPDPVVAARAAAGLKRLGKFLVGLGNKLIAEGNALEGARNIALGCSADPTLTNDVHVTAAHFEQNNDLRNEARIQAAIRDHATNPVDRQKARDRLAELVMQARNQLRTVKGSIDTMLANHDTKGALNEIVSVGGPLLDDPYFAAITDAVDKNRAAETSEAIKGAMAIWMQEDPPPATADGASSNPTIDVLPSTPPPLGVSFTTPLGLKMIYVHEGEFLMGDQARAAEAPPRRTTISRGFWLGETEVTRKQWSELMPATDRVGHGDDDIAVDTTWYLAQTFCSFMTEVERKAGRLPDGYRYELPTSAQWEYACRAGTTSTYWFGDDASKFATYEVQAALGQAQKVRTKQANPWGFYDMHGNVWEFCADAASGPIIPAAQGNTVDPFTAEGGDYRVLRGNRSAGSEGTSLHFPAYAGFRLALVPKR